jgi:hypothetical protein
MRTPRMVLEAAASGHLSAELKRGCWERQGSTDVLPWSFWCASATGGTPLQTEL